MNQRHLTDDQLVEMCMPGEPSSLSLDHLVRCTACEVRRATLARMLTDVSDAALADADAAFPLERLSRQHARILQRIDQDGRPGRLIAFPAGHPHGPSFLRAHKTTRWVAAAAAAAFIMGLLAGQRLPHDFSGQRTARVSPSAARATGTTLRAASIPVSDEEFLDEIEIAVGSGGPAVFRRIDALTPRAWESR
jgi:hypothetical protein